MSSSSQLRDVPPRTDVLVIGDGLAGSAAALEAARLGARVALVTAGPASSERAQGGIAAAVLLSAVLLPIAVFSLLRVAGDPKPTYDLWPYPTVKIYDPYGDLQRAGRPGPFYQ